jgi:PAS domain S-box-containing protein
MKSNADKKTSPKADDTQLRLGGFESIFQSAERGVVLLDCNGNIVESNPVANAILGLTEKDVDLYSALEAFTTGSLEFIHRIAEALKNRTNLEAEGFCEEKNKWLRIQYSCFEGGSIFYIRDITESKEHQKYVEELARFPEETWNPVLKFNIDGTIVYTNSRCDAILEAWNTQLHGKLPGDVHEAVKTSINTNTAQEVEVLCKNNQIFSILLAPVPEANATYVYGRDITRLKENEQELIDHRDNLEQLVSSRTKELEVSRDEAERANRAKSIFLANMSHEIRTPLAAIIGFAESLLDVRSEEENRHAIHTIIRSGNHLKNIVNNILDLSKIEAEKVEMENLEISVFAGIADIHSIINAQANAKGINFDIKYHYPLPEKITSDSVRLKQVLINLCNNAIKFTEQGGVIIELSCDKEKEKMIFNIIDTGIGMTQEQASKIFKPFTQADSSTTRKFGGTGLGLTLSKQFAALLGGDLTVKSEVGVGSTFTLAISTGPLQDVTFTNTAVHLTRSTEQSTRQTVTRLNGHVLLAEDTPELQELATYMIKRTGAKVTLAENGEVAIQKALEGDYDVIFMDMQMPVIDGYEAVRKLREKKYSKPIIAMTANTMKQDRDKALNSGCDGFIGKPVNRNELYTTLKKYLSSAMQQNTDSPIVSSLLDDEPEMRDLVEKFVVALPAMLLKCKTYFLDEDWQALKGEIHVLKALGGSHGFQQITDLAMQIEQHLHNDAEDKVDSVLKELDNISKWALAGL